MNFVVGRSFAHNFAKSLLYPRTVSNVLWNGMTSVFSYFLGERISQTLLPAQALKDDPSFVRDTRSLEAEFHRKLLNPEFSEISAENHVVSTHDDAELETLEITHTEQSRKNPADQQYIIYLVGNGMCYQDILRQCLSDCKEMKYNCLTYNYRNVMASTGTLHSKFDLISDLISQIERLRTQGVQAENINLCGHSLGAGIATVVAYIYSKMGVNMKLFNGRSFTTFSDLIYYQYPEGWSRTIWGNLARLKLKLTDLDIEALVPYLEIPEQNKSYIAVKESKREKDSKPDGVIDERVSLEYGLKNLRMRPKDLTAIEERNKVLYHGTKVLSFNRMFGCGHNDPIQTLRCKNLEENAQEYYRCFFSDAYRTKKMK